jgi:hypothetical protein
MRIVFLLKPVWRWFHSRVREWLESRALVLPSCEVDYWARRLKIPAAAVQELWDEAVRRRLLELWDDLR